MKLMFFIFSSIFFSMTSAPFDYDKAWKEVREAIDNGRPQDALNKSMEIYNFAKGEGNELQKTKAIAYVAAMKISTSEDGVMQADAFLSGEVKNTKSPYKEILHSYYAEFLNNYFDNNRYVISQRTEASDDENLLTMTTQKLVDKISYHYLQSLENDKGLRGELEMYKPLLNEYDENGRIRNPEIIDVLYTRALNFFTYGLQEFSGGSEQGIDKKYFASAENFNKISINEEVKVLRLYQKILKHQLDNNKINALAHFDLMRLRHVYNVSNEAEKDQMYEAALKTAIVSYKNQEISTEFQAALAELYMSKENSDKERFLKALNVCEDCIKAHPNSIGASLCKNMINTIKSKYFNLQGLSVATKGENIDYTVVSKNIEKIYLKIVNAPKEALDQSFENIAMFNKLPILKEWSLNLTQSKTYEETKTLGSIADIGYGSYLLIASNNPDFSESFKIMNFQVSDLAYIATSDSKGNSYLVVSRKDGKPIKGAKVDFYEQVYNYEARNIKNVKVGSCVSNSEGKVNNPGLANKSYKLIITKGKDIFDGVNMHYDGERYQNNQTYNSTVIFLDRAIYRPGQTVYFKAIYMNYDANQRPKLITNEELKLSLNDANGQEINNATYKTNEYGSASGSFTLPTGKLTGSFTIMTPHGGTSFLVEEYKRPTFEVKIDTITQAYKLGDKVTVKGKVIGLAGNNISNAKVDYSVYRRAIMPYCYSYFYFVPNDQMVAQGKTVADENGEFTFDFIAKEDAQKGINPINNFSITVNALDETGESRSGEYSFNLSKYSLFLEDNLKTNNDVADKTKVKIIAKNLADKPVKESGKYTIYKLREDASILSQPEEINYYRVRNVDNKFKKLAIEKIIITGPFVSNNEVDLSKLEPGIYKLEAMLDGSQADTLINYFTVSDFAKKKFPLSSYIHRKVNQPSFKVGEKVMITLGAAAQKQNVYYVLSNAKGPIKQGWLKVGKTASVEYVVKDEDKNSLSLSYIYIFNNKWYKEVVAIPVPWTEKELEIKYENFRDKLNPGEQADFKITISGKNKEKFQAEVLAAMYDASLDAYAVNTWRRILFPDGYSYVNLEAFTFGEAYANELNYMWQQNIGEEYINPIMPVLIGLSYNPYYAGGGNYPRGRMMKSANMEEAQAASVEAAPAPLPTSQKYNGVKIGDANAPSDVNSFFDVNDDKAMNLAQPQTPPILVPRTNLKESVFFYPHLKTNSNGDLVLSFKMNESLTKWKLMTFAHTKDLATAYDERFLQTQKELLIVANAPRFMREGDELTFTARVTNLTDKPMDAMAKLDISDELKDVDLSSFIQGSANVPVSLKPGESKAVAWKLKIQVNTASLVKYVVSATAGKYTDGESSSLPILSNRILVTESMAMYIKGNEKKTYEFTSMKNGGASQKPYKYTVEISSHPIWYAIQAMPYILEQNNQSASSLVTRYYTNSLSKYITNGYPKIEEIVNQWQASDSDALKSNLEKNSDLKNALLDETPWVVEAIEETKQKGNIQRLFDLNTVNADLAQTLEALRGLQMPDGSFTWFPGGRPDYYTTLYVSEMLGKVTRLNVDNNALEIANNANNFLDGEFKRNYDKMKSEQVNKKIKLEDYQPSQTEVLHLFVRSNKSYTGMANQYSEAYNFYRTQALKFWTKYDIYTQCLLGQVDYRNKGKVYEDIQKSVIQKSFKSDELGIYWNAGNGYQWYELPIERHAAIMEFLHEVNYDANAIDEMKIWLLKNKQGNHWSTPKSSAAAIAALLLHKGPRQANLDNDLAVIAKVGNDQLPGNAQLQAGTVYYKKMYAEDKIDKSMATINLSNPNPNIAWGAAYYQYFEDVNNIKGSNASPLKIEKQLYKEVVDGKGKSLKLIDKTTVLNPGDILVSRLIISSDRNMDYLHIKDLRASGLEPYNTLSGYRWTGSLGYYESIRDLATNYFIDHLNKGTHVFESRQKVVHKGRYSGGLATIQSFYAPEFGGKTEGNIISVE